MGSIFYFTDEDRDSEKGYDLLTFLKVASGRRII